MPVEFLSSVQRRAYGRYAGDPGADELDRYFHLDDADRGLIGTKRGDHNRLGFALQLATVRFLGRFLEDPVQVPVVAVQTIARQLQISDLDQLARYATSDQRWQHAAEIRLQYGYREWSDPEVGFRLGRWLFALCWTGTDQPGVLFDRTSTWLLSHKVILPGGTTVERFVARLRARVEERLWRKLGRGITEEQRARLDELLLVPELGGRASLLDRLRSGPVRVSGRALVQAIVRLQRVRDLDIKLPAATVPPSRIASLARFASSAKVTAIARLSPPRRLATLVAFVHRLEATALDDVIEVLDMLLHELFGAAGKADKKARLRSIKDLDQAAATLAAACRALLDPSLSGDPLAAVFSQIPREVLTAALDSVERLVRPPDDVYYRELDARWKAVRLFLPTLLRYIRFDASPAGKPVTASLAWLRLHEMQLDPDSPAPRDVITKAWQRHAVRDDASIDVRAYTFCVLDELRRALRRREVFVSPSWRYADPTAGLLAGAQWEAARPMVCRSLGLPADPAPALAALADELDQTYRAVAARLPANPAVRFEAVDGKLELILSSLDRLDEPPSLPALRAAVAARLPKVDLPEILLEIAARTGFTEAFTHLSERAARTTDLATSLCAVLLAEACNTGPEPLIRDDIPALQRDRLAWVNQNYLREDTMVDANARLVAAQNSVALAQVWGGGEVASADGMRFVVPIRTVHAGPNPKYFGSARGVTWYNLLSDQCSGLNAITVPGTLRDSLILLGVVLEQKTELWPTQIMTDTGAYSDVMFGLFRLAGYRFSPRIADVGGTRFWRIDPNADYGELNALARQIINLQRITPHWDDFLRLIGSLKMGLVPANGIMRTLQVSDRPTQLALALAEFGRIEKTLHVLNYIDDETRRRAILLQLNRGEARHSLARDVFHGKRGELRQRYREGQEDQLGALGLVVNVIVLWNTIYMDAAISQLRREGLPVRDDDVARLWPFIHEHINLLGRYSFAVPEAVSRGELRPLRVPDDSDSPAP